METIFLIAGLVLSAAILAAVAIVFKNAGRNRAATAALLLSCVLVILMAAGSAIGLTASPKIELSNAVKSNPGKGNAYISIMVTNNGDIIAKNCAGEMVVDGLSDRPLKVVWGDGSVNRDILPDGGSEKLYFLVADPDSDPVRVVPYYPSVFTPPREDDAWLLKAGEHTLTLTVRGENISPITVEMALHIGQTWDSVSCTIK